MRQSEFWGLVDDEFGVGRGRTLVRDQVLSGVGFRTAAEALESGADAREVWFALCREMEVPQERWWGRAEVTVRRSPRRHQ